jgi:hypothetical protein
VKVRIKKMSISHRKKAGKWKSASRKYQFRIQIHLFHSPFCDSQISYYSRGLKAQLRQQTICRDRWETSTFRKGFQVTALFF